MFKALMLDMAAFHTKFGQEYFGKIRALPMDYVQFRHKFLIEEANEWAEAQQKNHIVMHDASGVPDGHDAAEMTHNFNLALDSIIDLMYIALGCAHAQGFTDQMLKEAWTRVHCANMQKIKADKENPSMRGFLQYDIVKPQGWKPPDHSDLVEDHVYANKTNGE